LLAFHFDSTAAPDRFRAALTDGQKQVAATYEGFLKQIFGEGYLQFSETQRQWAVQRLPRSAFAASEAPASSWGDVGLETLLGTIQTADDIELVTNAQAAGDWAMEQVALEVFAETNGWAVWPFAPANGGLFPSLKRADEAALLPLWSSGRRYSLESGGSFAYALARLPDGRLRLMTFGDQAAELDSNATVRLHIPEALPKGWSGRDFFEQQAFREGARVFEAVPVTDEPCLGGPCYDFDATVGKAALAYGEQNIIELFIAQAPGAEPHPTSDLPVRRAQL
jgi:hypothetical protein